MRKDPVSLIHGRLMAFGFSLCITCLATPASATPTDLDKAAAYCATYWQSEKKLTDDNIRRFTASTPKTIRQVMDSAKADFVNYLKRYEEYRVMRVASVQDAELSPAIENAKADILQVEWDVAKCLKENADNDKELGPCVARSEAQKRTLLCNDAFVKRLTAATPLPASVNTVALSAVPGTFEFQVLGTPAKQASVSASLHLTRFNASDSWPPAAYLGFFQGQDWNNSVQFLIILNKKDDSFLVAGYRIVENGAEVKSEALANMPLDSKTNVTLSVDNGLVTVSIPPRVHVSFQTNLGEVTPYVSVSSGAAEFSITRGN